MRELVYLSEAKLRAFRPAPGRRRRAGLRGEIGVAGLANVGVDLPASVPPDGPTLDEVLDHLTGTPGMLRWYEEENLRPGQWIQFEARLDQIVLELAQPRPVQIALFAEPGSADGTRLLLHGSPEHLTAAGVSVPPDRDLNRQPSTAHAVRALFAQLDESPDGDEPLRQFHRRGLAALFRHLDARLDPRSAALLSGHARVTVAAGDFGAVVASPLCVEFAAG